MVSKWIKSVDTDRWPKDAIRKLERLIEEPGRVWEEEIVPAQAWLSLTEDGSERLRQDLRFEAIQMLIDACIRAHKREMESQASVGSGEGS